MNSSLHEKASEILGKAMEMDEPKARAFIEKECGSDLELKTLTLELYKNMLGDDVIGEESARELLLADKPVNTKGLSKSRIGPSGNKTKSVGNITRLLFSKKTNRFITMVAFLVVFLGFAFFVRSAYHQYVIEMESQEQIAMLEVNYKSLQQWIDLRTKLTADFAQTPDIVDIANRLDSLVELDPSYGFFSDRENMSEIYDELIEIREANEADAIGIVHKRDPVTMVLVEESETNDDRVFSNINLGPGAYVYYMRLKEEQKSMFIPPMRDEQLLQDSTTNQYTGTYYSFVEPIRKDSIIIGYLLNEYNAAKDFSNLLNASHHKKTAETYAFNLNGRMLSQSRYLKELQQTFLLDYDSTKESIYNIVLQDPGGSIFKSEQPKIPFIDQSFTRIMADAKSKIEGENPVYSGTLTKPYRDYRGIKVVGAWKYLPEYGFGIIDEIDASEARLVLRYFDGAFFLFVVLLIGLTFLLYKSNVRIANFGRRMDEFTKLGQYKLLRKIGEGGFGEVYKAEHTFLKNPVAIKLLKSEFNGTDMLDRFEKEVTVTASLANPSTIRVYDYGTSSTGQFYYVMEFLDGVALNKVVEGSELFPVGRAIHVLLQTCFSLAEAHKKGLVHRDIKPMNIMLCNQGGTYDTIKVLDFGLVKNLDTSISQHTQINRIGGTPMFMAPERIRDPYNADHRVDIYALGAVGLFMLSGQYLLELISQKMMSGQETLHGNFKKQLIERNDIPEKLKKLLEECVSFSPDKRPATISDIIARLEELKKQHPWNRDDAEKWWKKYDVYA